VRDDAMTQEYSKSILFDYSYKYFYENGFGKDFDVLNLKSETNSEQTTNLLLANALAFQEQKRAFEAKPQLMLKYNLSDPLWIFVGSTVNKSKNDKQARESDVLTVVMFLDCLLTNEKRWVQKAIQKILNGKSGLEDENGHDVFASRLKSLKAWSRDPDAIYQDLLKRIFHTSTTGRLHLADIKSAQGELGLRVGAGGRYFGLIYIGDTNAFKTLIQKQRPEVGVDQDEISDGLFKAIKGPESSINILVGAKKFIQGWNSWRVSNMGLLNIGRSEGSEIIQLFGRGVRLQGMDSSLKRSSALHTNNHPSAIAVLERLNIFAI